MLGFYVADWYINLYTRQAGRKAEILLSRLKSLPQTLCSVRRWTAEYLSQSQNCPSKNLCLHSSTWLRSLRKHKYAELHGAHSPINGAWAEPGVHKPDMENFQSRYHQFCHLAIKKSGNVPVEHFILNSIISWHACQSELAANCTASHLHILTCGMELFEFWWKTVEGRNWNLSHSGRS